MEGFDAGLGDLEGYQGDFDPAAFSGEPTEEEDYGADDDSAVSQEPEGGLPMEEPVFLPEEGRLPLQFFHIADLCRLLERILEERPAQHVLNCGNPEAITALEWVRLCASAAGTPVETRPIPPDVPVRSCFPFHPYAYELDVSLQQQLLPGLTPIDAGLQDCWRWWRGHRELIRRKPLMDFIRTHLLT
jgi:nucleoside-diphosphate-sugar epimerase